METQVEVSAADREKAWEEVASGLVQEVVRLRAQNLTLQDIVRIQAVRIEELDRDDDEADSSDA